MPEQQIPLEPELPKPARWDGLFFAEGRRAASGRGAFVLPPLAEQRRIVARVDQLMSLCDKLEAGLLRSQADSERLMEAVVGRMLAG